MKLIVPCTCGEEVEVDADYPLAGGLPGHTCTGQLYVGIDQSYSGFALCAYYPSVDNVQEVVWKYPPAKYGSGIDRLNVIAADVMNSILELNSRNWTVAHVCMEGYASDRKFGRELAGELGATVKRALHYALPTPVAYPTIVPPTSLKKFVTGAGNAAKDNMLLSVYKKWGKEYKDNNLADAYGLARMAEALHTGVTAFKYEEEALAKLHPHTEQFPQAA